jgi:hypothetical protein
MNSIIVIQILKSPGDYYRIKMDKAFGFAHSIQFHRYFGILGKHTFEITFPAEKTCARLDCLSMPSLR